ncbi:MAG: HEAT repeat domain-containing protein [Pirellulales bacterium]
MLRKQSLLLPVALVVAAFLAGIATGRSSAAASDDPVATAKEKQRQLIEVLQSGAPPQDKAITCKQLAVYGDKESVPALESLLFDPQLASWARIALEAIPGPEADRALREAAGQLQGRLLVGVIHSIGVRRDAKAVGVLRQRLSDAEADVASAAGVALGRIGDAAAVKILEPALSNAPEAVRSAVAEGCILGAEKAMASENRDEAIRIYDLVRQADVPRQRLLEATRGAILARQIDGVPLLVEQLRASDPSFFALGLTVARELPGSEVTQALVAELNRPAPARQALLMLVLADRGDKQALPAILTTAENGSGPARLAAFRVLKRLGDASCIPVLLDAALADDTDLSRAAVEVLADLPGDDVDGDLAARLRKAGGNTRRVLIQVAGLRQIADTVPTLIAAADDPDDSTRLAAITALGFIVPYDDLAVLISRVANPSDRAEEEAAAEAALRVACERMPDREACAGKLVDALSSAPVSAQVSLLEILAVMGGDRALKAMGDAAKDPATELQDASSRLLGEWMSVDAATVLLDLAQTAPEEKYEIRAMRGYIRLARQFTMSDEERVEMCRVSLQTAKRVAEKKLVLEVLARYPSIDTLRLAVAAARDSALANDAKATGLTIAQKIGGNAVDVQQLLAQLGQEPMKVEIIKAEYGAEGTFLDVTEILRRYVRNLPLILLPSAGYNSSLGGDPLPGVPKQLKIQYQIDGKPGETAFPENATILLPVPKN